MGKKKKQKFKEIRLPSDEKPLGKSEESLVILLKYNQQHGLNTSSTPVVNIRESYVRGFISKKIFKALLGVATRKDNSLKREFPEFFDIKTLTEKFEGKDEKNKFVMNGFLGQIRERLKNI